MEETSKDKTVEQANKASELDGGLYGPEVLKGIKSEIIAGGVLVPKDEADRSWNSANARAARIIDKYIKGEGMFQM